MNGMIKNMLIGTRRKRSVVVLISCVCGGGGRGGLVEVGKFGCETWAHSLTCLRSRRVRLLPVSVLKNICREVRTSARRSLLPM